MSNPVRLLLMYFVVPFWLLVGVGDWACHRKTHIERNAGPKESALHLLMLAEIGLPLLMALFLKINATVIAVMLVALAVHEATAWWDVRYAASRRHISDFEQHMHSWLEALPFTALALILVRHWNDFLALPALLGNAALPALEWKQNPLPLWYVVTLLVSVLLFGVLPYVEELIRCCRTRAEDTSGIHLSGRARAD